MSNPERRPESAVDVELFNAEEVPDVDRTWFVDGEAMTPVESRGHRTVDAPRTYPAGRLELRHLIRCAADILDAIERASETPLPGAARRSRLAFGVARNTTTGDLGLVVRRWLGRDRYSPPLAELLTHPGRVVEEARDFAHGFARHARNEALEICVHTRRDETDHHPVVMTGYYEDADEEPAFYLLARLLVTPYEVGQWSDELIETEAPEA